MKKILTYFYSLTLITSNSIILTSCNSQTTEKFEISKVNWLQENHAGQSVTVQFTGNGNASDDEKDYKLFQFSSDISKKTIVTIWNLWKMASNNVSIYIYYNVYPPINSITEKYNMTPMIEGNYLAVEYQGKIVVTDTPFEYDK